MKSKILFLLLASILSFPACAPAADPARSESGGGGGEAYEEIKPPGYVLVGFKYSVGDLSSSLPIPVIKALQPIYQTPQGTVTGALQGTVAGPLETIQARNGYAVGGLAACTGTALDRIKIKFMRIVNSGAALDPTDAYESEWCGGRGGDRVRYMGYDGQPVVGIFGRKSDRSLTVGLAYRDKSYARAGDRTEEGRPPSTGLGNAVRPGTGSAPVPPGVAGSATAPSVNLRQRQSRTRGLLLQVPTTGDLSGWQTEMSATVRDTVPYRPGTVVFKQNVGAEMQRALGEVVGFLQVRHNGWPKGVQVELAFADKYIPDDGASAAVSSALLVNSLIAGLPIDSGFAATGDLDSAGRVLPVRGVMAKLRAAINGRCELVAIPQKNERQLLDFLVTEGPGPLVAVQVFGITSFDEAESLAAVTKSPALAAATASFAKVQDLCRKNPSQTAVVLKNPQIIALLRQVVQQAPNHLSAKCLLLYSGNGGTQIPAQLSIVGSMEPIDSGHFDLALVIAARLALIKAIENLQSGKGSMDLVKAAQVLNTIDNDKICADVYYKLTRIKPTLNQKVWPYLNAVAAAAKSLRQTLNPNAPGASVVVKDISTSLAAVDTEKGKLLALPELREELGNLAANNNPAGAVPIIADILTNGTWSTSRGSATITFYRNGSFQDTGTWVGQSWGTDNTGIVTLTWTNGVSLNFFPNQQTRTLEEQR